MTYKFNIILKWELKNVWICCASFTTLDLFNHTTFKPILMSSSCPFQREPKNASPTQLPMLQLCLSISVPPFDECKRFPSSVFGLKMTSLTWYAANSQCNQGGSGWDFDFQGWSLTEKWQCAVSILRGFSLNWTPGFILSKIVSF